VYSIPLQVVYVALYVFLLTLVAVSGVAVSLKIMHIPEVITGLGGAALIGLSLWSSIRHNRREKVEGHVARQEELHA